MSAANRHGHSSTAAQPAQSYYEYDYDDNPAHSHSEYESEDSFHRTSASSDSEIGPGDSASIPAARGAGHTRYHTHSDLHPPYSQAHNRSQGRDKELPRKLRHPRPPEQHHQHHRPGPARHASFVDPVSSPSDPSEVSASLDSHYSQGFPARGSYYEPHHDDYPYQDPYYLPQAAHYTAPPTMMSSTTSGSHFSNGGAALTTYDYQPYTTQHYPYAGQASAGNPFMPHAPSPQPGYYYDMHGNYQPQRPEMVARASMPYLPADVQYPGHPTRAYPPVHPEMMHAMMQHGLPRYVHHSYPPTPGPDEKPAKPDKKEDPPPAAAPPAPAAPPPPTAEEIAKKMKEDAELQAKTLFDAIKNIHEADKAQAAAAEKENQKAQAESDKIAALLAGFEKERLAREEAAAAKAAAEKAEAEAKAAREKELADAATAARVNAEKEAANAAALAKAENEKAAAEAKAEHEKKLAEAKAAADAAEAAKKAAEEELAKNAPGPDADKPPIKFTDAVERNFTLPWHLVKNYKGMETLIKQAFVNIERVGPHVINGRYHLLGPNNEIILPQVWDIVVQPGWDIKMQLWPLPPDEVEAIPEPIVTPVPIGKPPRGNKVSGSKSAGKRASLGPASMPPLTPPVPPIHHASPPPPPTHIPTVFAGHEDPNDPIIEVLNDNGGGGGRSKGGSGGSRPKNPANSKKKSQVSGFHAWMLGGMRTRPKGAEKPAAAGGVKVRRVIVQK